jgi:hypothetical protein
MLQKLKLNNETWKKSPFYEEKSLVGLTPGFANENSLKLNFYFSNMLMCKKFFVINARATFKPYNKFLGLKHMTSGPHVARQLCLCGPRSSQRNRKSLNFD